MRPSPPAARAVRWPTRLGPGLLIVAAAALAYANSIAVPFVFDDLLAIPQNPSLRRLWPLSEVLFPRVPGGVTVSGRPVLNLSFALNHAVSGTQVWSYHLVNLLIHAASGLLLYGLVRRTWARSAGADAVSGRGPALPIAALWTVHPLQTQAVTYTVQRAESLLGFFFLLTLYAFVRGAAECNVFPDTRSARRWRQLSVAACAVGMGTKEVMVTAPLLVLLYDRTFVAGSFAAAWRARRGWHLALAATWLLLGALVLAAGGNRGGTVGPGVGLPIWAYPLTQFEAVARYLALGVWPHPLVFEYGTRWVRHAGDVLPYAAVVLPLLGATAVALRRWPRAGFLGAWFFLILAPTSLAPGTIQMTVEHRMYLPLAAAIAGLVCVLRRVGGPRLLPEESQYRYNLALTLAEAGRIEDAVRHYRLALRLHPDEARAHNNLAILLVRLGRNPEALPHYAAAVRLSPTEPLYACNHGVALLREGRPEAAAERFEAALRLDPGHLDSRFNLGATLVRLNRIPEAATHFEEVVRRDPRHAAAHFKLGNARLDLERPADARRHFAAALAVTPDEAECHHNLGIACARLERWDEARRAFDAALRLKPDYADARRHREQLRQVTGR